MTDSLEKEIEMASKFGSKAEKFSRSSSPSVSAAYAYLVNAARSS
jgi:hypothetical protein